MAVAIEPPPQPTPVRARPPLRKTSPAVRLVDKLSTVIITAGGILVIIAVLGILVYLVTVVVPLFRGATVGKPTRYPLFPPGEGRDLLFAELNEYKTLGFALESNGRLTVFEGRSGKVTETRPLFPAEPTLTAFSRTLRDGHVAFGFADGTVRIGEIAHVIDDVRVTIEEPLAIGREGVAVRLLDYKTSDRGDVLTTLKTDGELVFNEVSRRENLITGKVNTRVNKHSLPYGPAETPPAFLLQTPLGDQLYIAWRDGMTRRYDLRDLDNPKVAEIVDLAPGPDEELTDLRFMFGNQSLIASDSRGGVTAWFRVERPNAGTSDGYQMLPAHKLEPHNAPVTVVGNSTRDKGLVTGTTRGDVYLRHMTSEQTLGRLRTAEGAAIETLQITPKADGIFAVDRNGIAWLWDIHNPHPEITWRSIFGKVWYEGYPEPAFTWQSSSGTDDFEPKFSLVPLIYGSLKATVYSMIFAVPMALLGAIYTSQFLDKRLRQPLKSAIETMASLPSVVLGFIAALVLAPIVENWVVAVLTAFCLIPLCVVLCGYLWQMMPQYMIIRLAGLPQYGAMMVVVLLALAAGRYLGGPVEDFLFVGDFKGWLDGRVGTATPGFAILLWPLALLFVWYAQRKWIAGRMGPRLNKLGRVRVGLLELIKLLLILIVTTVVAWALGSILAAFGLDLRGTLVDTYVQRNTLVVGFVMGFAVIPIIYTISEDAISSVPEHLKSASLGCGATPWQTAVRVIVPVAMSGIFSAIMIGLGRAVGETMIVVMAAGNTPLMDANIFNGLRALSANIAVELPEAVKDSTLFRMLFLAALTLFVMTFLINTLAEIIRIRFRKRAFQL